MEGGSVLNWPQFSDNIITLQSCYLHWHSLPFPRQWTGPLTFHLKCIMRCVGVLCAFYWPLHIYIQYMWAVVSVWSVKVCPWNFEHICNRFIFKLCILSVIQQRENTYLCVCISVSVTIGLKKKRKRSLWTEADRFRVPQGRREKNTNTITLWLLKYTTQIMWNTFVWLPSSFLCACLPQTDAWIQATVLTLGIFHIFNQVSN